MGSLSNNSDGQTGENIDWRDLTSQAIRNHVVDKLVQGMLPTNDSIESDCVRTNNLIDYARNTEQRIYQLASSRSEYFHMMAVEIYRIKKESEEERMRRIEQQQQNVCEKQQQPFCVSEAQQTQQPIQAQQTQALQQSHDVVGANVLGADGTGTPKTGQEKRKLIQQRLVLLLHTQKCQQQNNKQVNGEVPQCTLPHCRTMKTVLNHMPTCEAGMICPVPHCHSSRQIIYHWKNCSNSECSICLPIRKANEKSRTTENDVQQSNLPTVNHIGPNNQCGSGGNMTEQQQHSNIQPAPTFVQGNSNDSHQNTEKPPPNYIKSMLKYPDVDAVMASLLEIDWRDLMTEDLRNYLVYKVIQDNVPTDDPIASNYERMNNLVAYAKKIEGRIYHLASSRSEYYRLLAKKIYNIQVKLEEKRQQNV